MLKKFYITKAAEGVNAPSLDRFQRMEQLNDMLHNDELLETMHKNIKTFKKQDSSKNLYRLLREKVD